MQRRTRLNILLVLGIAVTLVFVSISCTQKRKPTVAEAEKVHRRHRDSSGGPFREGRAGPMGAGELHHG